MKKNKELLLICVLFTIISAIIIILVIVLNNKHIDNNSNNSLYGKWIADSSEIYENDLITSYVEEINDKYIVISNNNIELCYMENDKNICDKVNYTYIGNILKIEDNNMYLSGEEEITLDGDYLTMKYHFSGANSYSLMHFKRG